MFYYQHSDDVNYNKGKSYLNLKNQPSASHNQMGAPVLKTGFSGIWKVVYPSSLSPQPRKECFSIQSQQHNGLFIGYGINQELEYFNDIWFLDYSNFKWRQLKLTGYNITPRAGTRGVVLSNNLILFGGYANKQYLDELHRVDINTGEVFLIETTGTLPPSSTTPIIAYYNHSLYLYGGYNLSESSDDLYVLNLDTFVWECYPQSCGPRISMPWVYYGSTIYSFGGSKAGGLLTIDMDARTVKVEKTTGAEPNSSLLGSQMVLVEKYIFFIGGKCEASGDNMLLYALDLDRKWWFVFHIMPDLDSTSYDDGNINELGLFEMPLHSSFTVGFIEKNREIVITLGTPFADPPPIQILSIGDALGVIHLREDMVASLKRNINK